MEINVHMAVTNSYKHLTNTTSHKHTYTIIPKQTLQASTNNMDEKTTMI